MVFDDIQLPQVRSLIESFVERDDRWQKLVATGKWMAYRRLSEGPLVEGELNQPFFPVPRPTLWRRVKSVVPVSLKRKLRQLWAPASSSTDRRE